MNTKLDEAFNLRPQKEAEADIEDNDLLKEAEKNAVTPAEAIEHAAEIVNALSAAEKVDHALTIVAGLNEHDTEMDEIAREALESYEELKELGMNMSDSHSGRIMEVAATMLKTALEARDAKVNRKLKTIELQLKKMKIDKDSGKDEDDDSLDTSQFLDRNHLLKSIRALKDIDSKEE